MLAKSAIIGFTLLLGLFWFYGFYHLVIILFSYYKKSNISEGQDKGINLSKKPAVALLYTTCDDFDEEAVLSCFNQNYSNFQTFKDFGEFLSMSISNHKIILVSEAAFAVLFLFISFSTDNIWFLSFGSGILIGILLFIYGFENKLLKHLVFVPFIVMAAVILLIIKTLQ